MKAQKVVDRNDLVKEVARAERAMARLLNDRYDGTIGLTDDQFRHQRDGLTEQRATAEAALAALGTPSLVESGQTIDVVRERWESLEVAGAWAAA